MWNDLTYEQLTVAAMTLVAVVMLCGWLMTAAAYRRALRDGEAATWGRVQAESKELAVLEQWRVERDRRIAAEERVYGYVAVNQEIRAGMKRTTTAVRAVTK